MGLIERLKNFISAFKDDREINDETTLKKYGDKRLTSSIEIDDETIFKKYGETSSREINYETGEISPKIRVRFFTARQISEEIAKAEKDKRRQDNANNNITLEH